MLQLIRITISKWDIVSISLWFNRPLNLGSYNVNMHNMKTKNLGFLTLQAQWHDIMGQVLMGLTTASMKKKQQQQMCESSNVAKYWSSKQCYYGQLKRPLLAWIEGVPFINKVGVIYWDWKKIFWWELLADKCCWWISLFKQFMNE